MGGGEEYGLENMRIEQVQKLDPASERRQVDFWNQAQEYASTSPFQAQYGGAADMPGLGRMSQRGQQYLTNQILGPGAYGPSVTGNLGFADYVEPASRQASPGWAYDPNIEPIPAIGTGGPGLRGSAVRSGTGGVRPNIPGQDPPPPREGRDGIGDIQVGGCSNVVDPATAEPRKGDPFIPMPPVIVDPTPPALPGMGSIDIDRPDGYSTTVGVEEMQRAGDATRALLGQTGPVTPSYSAVTAPTIATPTLTTETDISAGTGAVDVPEQGYGYDPTEINAYGEPVSGVTTGSVQTIGESSIAGPQTLSPSTTLEDFGFDGASYIGSDLTPYMNQLGIESQIESAKLDYARAQNEEQARRAGSHAWGTRGDIPRAEQESAMLARIADIRRQGFTDAADRLERDLARQQTAGMQTQQLGAQALMQTQQLAQAGDIRGAELQQQARLQQQSIEGDRRQQDAAREQQARLRNREIDFQRQLENRQAGLQAGMQGQDLTARADMQDANNALRVAEANMQAALQENNQLAALQAQQQIALAQATLDQQQSNQTAGLQSAGMGLDAQQAFRAQQLAAAQQLADIGGMRQGATFGAAQQLAGMGAAQDQARRGQQAFGYDQWLRGLEGGAEQLAMLQAMQPGGAQYQYGRKPSVLGQIGGGLLQGAGAAAALGQAGLISDVRLKENIELVGSKNGHNLYEFNYRNQDARWRGVMAQEVMLTRPDAVGMRGGVLAVNYDALGLRMEAV